MENEIVVREEQSLTAVEIRKQVNLIQEVMKEVMKEGQHFGRIPGCGDKPTLLKPGAEKLSMTFRLRPIMDNDRDIAIIDFQNGHREVRVYCHIYNTAGLELATGIGSCSTMESKYRYRGGEKVGIGKPVPTEYWNLKKAGKVKEAQELIGGAGLAPGKIDGNWEICRIGEKMENPDIADTYNTVLKMAKKRAYVDGILSATGASDIFTQDIEDLPAEMIHTETPVAKKQTVVAPKEKTENPAKNAKSEPVKENTPGTELNVLDALKQPEGATFDVWGILFDHKSMVTKTKKDVTYYKLSPRGSTVIMEISKFGKAHVGIANGDVIKFTGVKVSTYNGELKYLAQGIEVITNEASAEGSNAD